MILSRFISKLNLKPWVFYGTGFIVLELLSYFSLFNPLVNQVTFGVLIVATFLVALYKLEYGWLIVLGELFIGSMGRLFVVEISGFTLSLRMALWLVILTVFVGKLIHDWFKNKQAGAYFQALKNFKPGKYFLILALLIIIGLVNAYARGNDLLLIFNDFNGWLYYLLLLPAIIVYAPANKNSEKNLKTLFISAAVWLGIKTFLLLYVFTHNLSFSSEVYFWLRKTLVGEMTATLSGWPRIFIQGQIFAAAALFLVFWQNFKIAQKQYLAKVGNLILAALFMGVLLISFSRSFWLALILTLGFLLIVVWRVYSGKHFLRSILWLVAVSALAFGLLYLTTVFPYPRSGSFNADFAGRANIGNSGEAAISSRWSLLPVLMKEIIKEPIFGQGYGATVTYISNDPRVLEKNPLGLYTTYAFEWGYLDTWLKIGAIALFTYLLLIFYLIKQALILGYKHASPLLFGLAGTLIFLAITNFFTPYLNHPLGIGVIVLGACLINKYRVY